jgi:hypothetical protein
MSSKADPIGGAPTDEPVPLPGPAGEPGRPSGEVDGLLVVFGCGADADQVKFLGRVLRDVGLGDARPERLDQVADVGSPATYRLASSPGPKHSTPARGVGWNGALFIPAES